MITYVHMYVLYRIEKVFASVRLDPCGNVMNNKSIQNCWNIGNISPYHSQYLYLCTYIRKRSFLTAFFFISLPLPNIYSRRERFGREAAIVVAVLPLSFELVLLSLKTAL